jgi:hypothetical protein
MAAASNLVPEPAPDDHEIEGKMNYYRKGPLYFKRLPHLPPFAYQHILALSASAKGGHTPSKSYSLPPYASQVALIQTARGILG